MTEDDIEAYFSRQFESNLAEMDPKKAEYFKMWYKARNEHPYTYRHDAKIRRVRSGGGGKYFDCDTITDEWYKWFLTTPANLNPFANPGNSYKDGTNAFLFNKENTHVYFAAASPFHKPDFRRIAMTEKAPLLVPVYNMYASLQDYPSLKTEDKLTDLVKRDLAGIRGETVEAYFDGKPIYGCCVIRDKQIPIENIPKDNVLGIPEDRFLEQKTGSTMDLCHGGFWLLIKEDVFKAGDHLLYFKAEAVNYEMEAKILINVLV